MPPLWDMGIVQMEDFSGSEVIPVGELHGVGYDIAMGKDGALRLAGSAASVE